MREDLLSVITSAKDVTNAIVLTHNIDFLFIQSVLVPALRKCGSPKLTIFADAYCSEETYHHQHRFLSALGLRYRVVPVAMKPGFRFHPKAVLLSGTAKATLLIGSGNLTFGGWRENAEVWFRYDTDLDGTAPFAGFRNYLQQIVALCADPKLSISYEAEEAFDAASRQWASSIASPSRVLGRAGQGQSLLDQMKFVLKDRVANELLLCTPYFDDDAEALRLMAQEIGVNSCTVLVQSGRTNLLASAAASLGPMFSLKAVSFRHREQIGSNGEERVRAALLHAKIYAILSGSEVVVFAGSANCSRAALTIPGSAGNAELMTWAVVSKEEFDSGFRSELILSDSAPVLPTENAPNAPVDAGDFIHIDAARFELGQIEVAYRSSDELMIQSVRIDGASAAIVAHDVTHLTVRSPLLQPRTVVLIGKRDGREIHSSPHWIDNEAALRISARSRSLAESINGLVRTETWSIGAWTEILVEVHKHLAYLPKSIAPGSPRRATSRGMVEFGWADVFSDHYRLPLRSALADLHGRIEGRITSLRSLLLHWYGITQPEPVGPPAPHNGKGNGTDGDGPAPPPKPPVPPKPATAQERKRSLKWIREVADRFGSSEFIADRPPELIAADLKIAAVLLRAGVADDWLDEKDFLDATLRVWLPLFFNADGDEPTGWLEQRYLTAPDPNAFSEAMRSAELSAALACWALSTPKSANSPEYGRFVLASALSVARLPWLWQGGSNEEIARQVGQAFAYTARDGTFDADVIESRWLDLIRRGYALNRLHNAIARVNVVELSKRILQQTVQPGELLWQGKYGFCVANSNCSRTVRENCEVLLLQRGNRKQLFHGPLLIPVAGLLDDRVVDADALPRNARDEIASMVQELRISQW